MALESMQLNPLGLVAGLTAFLSIWLGHVVVRKVEYVSPTVWLPALLFASASLGLGYASTLVQSRSLSVALGIASITLLWDALEVTRQQRRVRKGHAPANPQNPRHAAFLASGDPATTRDLLKHGPRRQDAISKQSTSAVRKS